MKKKANPKTITEFRRDIVSGEWVLISSARQRRPQPLAAEKKHCRPCSKKDCPFENPQKFGNPPPILWYPRTTGGGFDDWFIQVIPNKYPALLRSGVCPKSYHYGPYKKMEGFGSHEIIITRDHAKDLKKMSAEEIILVLRAYKGRYKMLESEKCVEYILIFHNQGELAGASISHPHSQLVALPIVPPDVSRSISGGIGFFEKNKKCVHCVMLDWEKKEKKRIIFQNKYFIAFVPYASRVSYEVRIFPKKHSSDFEEISEKEMPYLAEAMKDVLSRIAGVLKNPDYNFFIHTSSAKVKNVPYYHWHMEILPRTYKWAGMELGTGIEVIAVPPEEAAENLREFKAGK